MTESLPELSPEQNAKACQLIIRSVAGFPQSGDHETLVTDNVLRTYDYTSRHGVTFADLSAINPSAYDGLESDVHRIHEAFGIPARPDAGQIGFRINHSAVNSVYAGYSHTVEAYLASYKPLPDMLTETDLFGEDCRLNTGLGVVLHETLIGDAEIAGLVIGSVRKQAEKARRHGTAERRRLIQSFGSHRN